MELVEQVVRDINRGIQFQEELKAEILSLKCKIALEEQDLSSIKKEGDHLGRELSLQEEKNKSLCEQEELLGSIRETSIRALQRRLYLKKCAATMEPNNEQMQAVLQEMQNRYSKLIEHYELKPEYKQIIEAETTTRQLSQKLAEKRNELMKLETEREYS